MENQITEKKERRYFPSLGGALSLQILSGGYARVGRSWSGSAIALPFSRLYFILDGAFRLRTPSGREMCLSAGNLYLIPSGYSAYYGCDGVCEQVYFHIRFAENSGIDLLGALGEPISMPLGDEGKALSAHVSAGGCSEFLYCYGAVCTSLATLLDRSGVTLAPPALSPEVAETVAYMTAHPSVRLTLSVLSSRAHVSPATLSRRFRRETGMSVGEYLDRLILSDAERRLREGELSVKAISELYGFCDQFYFSRRFKEKLGISPRAYRREGLT